jgi:hypothetical protein
MLAEARRMAISGGTSVRPWWRNSSPSSAALKGGSRDTVIERTLTSLS